MIYLIRHAQASYLTDDYDRLSHLGNQQTNALAMYMVNHISINGIYVGPHKRQQQTALKIQQTYNEHARPIPTPIFTPELKEHSGPATLHHHKPTLIRKDPHCMQWHEEATKNPNELRANSINIFEYFIPKWMNNEFRSEGLEDYASFRKEITKGMKSILANHLPDENIVLVSSAGSISTIIALLTDLQETNRIAQLSFEILNASITSLKLVNENWVIDKFNQVDHLTDEMKTVV